MPCLLKSCPKDVNFESELTFLLIQGQTTLPETAQNRWQILMMFLDSTTMDVQVVSNIFNSFGANQDIFDIF